MATKDDAYSQIALGNVWLQTLNQPMKDVDKVGTFLLRPQTTTRLSFTDTNLSLAIRVHPSRLLFQTLLNTASLFSCTHTFPSHSFLLTHSSLCLSFLYKRNISILLLTLHPPLNPNHLLYPKPNLPLSNLHTNPHTPTLTPTNIYTDETALRSFIGHVQSRAEKRQQKHLGGKRRGMSIGPEGLLQRS